MIRYSFKSFDFETVYEKFPLVDIIEDTYNRYGREIPLFYWKTMMETAGKELPFNTEGFMRKGRDDKLIKFLKAVAKNPLLNMRSREEAMTSIKNIEEFRL